VPGVRDAIERGDCAAFGALLDPSVVWVGVQPEQLCRNRDDVLAMLVYGDNASRRFAPETLLEREGVYVVDPHPDPPPEWVPDLCQVILVRAGRIGEMRDYAGREAALAAAEAVG